MDNRDSLQLNTGWVCEYLELEPDLYEFMHPLHVPDLAAWSFDRRRLHGWVAYLYRTFTVPRLPQGLSLFLLIDAAPSPSRIYVNGQHIGDYIAPDDDSPPYELEITMYVNVGQNQISFRVEAEAAGHFEGLSLQQVPGS